MDDILDSSGAVGEWDRVPSVVVPTEADTVIVFKGRWTFAEVG